ncbi:phosphate signaling complex protein PhoU [Amycolatopsis sp. NPDC023774]|uniref:phosphate signaling complex protein PhoU n=1 Tax=Amycolatopsis sp. NPDC023774 TaxID=3155015 RepID=UPI0033DBDAF8
MRDSFHGELSRLRAELGEMCAFSGQAMRHATMALLTADLVLAEQVLSGDAQLDAWRAECEEQAQVLLALQAPVASELRLLVAVVYCADDIERMGDLAAHIAGMVRFRHPHHVVAGPLETKFRLLGILTAGMAAKVADLIVAPAEGVFAQLEDTDRAVDDLHRGILDYLTSPAWPDDHAAAACAALLSRFYERFGDHAVSVARRFEFAVSGTLPV